MKKTLFLTALAICALSLVAEEVAGGGASTMDVSRYRDVGLLNTENYAKKVNDDINFVSKAKLADMPRAIQIAGLDGAPNKFDTAEEITLLSATAGVINVRPVEAARMLPADDPVLVDLQLGAMLYMKKAVVSFLGNGDPAKYAVELKFITDRGNVTNADIENFMVQGIAAVVDKYYSQRGMYGIVPSAVYAEWKQNGVSYGLDGLQIVKDKLTAFYLAPTQQNFAALRGIDASYEEVEDKYSDPLAYEAGNAFYKTLRELNDPLWSAIIHDGRSSAAAIAAAGSAGRDLGIFSLPYATGGGGPKR